MGFCGTDVGRMFVPETLAGIARLFALSLTRKTSVPISDRPIHPRQETFHGRQILMSVVWETIAGS